MLIEVKLHDIIFIIIIVQAIKNTTRNRQGGIFLNKIIFDIQRFSENSSGETASDALDLMHNIIQRFDLKEEKLAIPL